MKLRYLNRYIPHIIAVLLLVVGVVSGLVLVQTPQEFREQAAPGTSLLISPSSQTKSPNESVTLSVIMNTGSNEVVGMDLYVTFDPSVLQVNSITKGSGVNGFDSVIRNNIDNNTGALSYSAFTVDRTKAVSGNTIVALTIAASIKPNAALGTTNITLSPQTSMAALAEGQNVVVSKVGATLTVVSGSVSPTSFPSLTLALTQPVTQTPTTIPSSGNGNSGGSSNGSNNSAPVSSLKRSDVNGDGKVNVLDLSIILSNFLKAGGKSDLNGDGKTNILDLSILLSNWNK